MTLNTFTAYTKAQASQVNENFQEVNTKLSEISRYMLIYTPYTYSESVLHVDEEIKIRINGTNIERSINNTSTWSVVQVTSATITSLWYNPANTNYIVVWNTTEGWYSTDGGVNWTEFTLTTSTKYAIGTDGTLYSAYISSPTSNWSLKLDKSINDGSTWTNVKTKTTGVNDGDAYNVLCLSDNILGAWGNDDTAPYTSFFISNDGGSTFSEAAYNSGDFSIYYSYIDTNNYSAMMVDFYDGGAIYGYTRSVEGSTSISTTRTLSGNITLYRGQHEGDGVYYYSQNVDTLALGTVVFQDTSSNIYTTGLSPVIQNLAGKSNLGNYIYGSQYGTTYYKKNLFQMI